MSQENDSFDLYINEAILNINALEELFYHVEADKKFDEQQIAEAFRLVHTLKGSSAMMQLSPLEHSSHALENTLARIRDAGGISISGENKVILDACFLYSQYFLDQIERLKTGNQVGSSIELDEKLAALLEKSGTDKNAVSKPKPAADYDKIDPEILKNGLHFKLKIKVCAMPHLRASLIIRAALPMLEKFATRPADLKNCADWAKEITIDGFELFAIPKNGIKKEALIERLSAQPFFESCEECANSIPQAKNNDRMLHIPQAKINTLITMIGELISAESSLEEILFQNGKPNAAAELQLSTLNKYLLETQGLAAEIGMFELGVVFNQMRRLIHSMVGTSGKQIRTEIFGAELLADSGIIDIISDAMIHIVRNAVDHGIEEPKDRLAANKSEVGTITILAQKQNNCIVASVSDDGAGIDPEAIKKKAIKAGLLKDKDAELTDKELFRILASPGFSTNKIVTQYSGRGVGLDTAVKRVKDVGGDMWMVSKRGAGTTFYLQIPTTLSTVKGLEIIIDNEHMIVPVDNIVHIGRLPDGSTKQNKAVFNNEEYEKISFINYDFQMSSHSRLIYFKFDGGNFYLRVDRTRRVKDYFAKPLPEYVFDVLNSRCAYSGCIIRNDSRVLGILDVGRLASQNQELLKGENNESI